MRIPFVLRRAAPLLAAALLAVSVPLALPAAASTCGGCPPSGFWLAATDGGVFTYGNAPFWGSLGATRLNQPIVGIAEVPRTPSGDTVQCCQGYWMAAADGGVFTFGSAPFYGSLGGFTLAQPIVAIAATADGGGYWLLDRAGGVFTFGDAHYAGNPMGETKGPAVGIASSADGLGYLIVDAAGQVFGYGNAPSVPATGGSFHVGEQAVGIAMNGTGTGYWIAGAQGGVVAFGPAPYSGSASGMKLTKPIIGIGGDLSGGYWLIGADAVTYPFGGASQIGPTKPVALNRPVVAISTMFR